MKIGTSDIEKVYAGTDEVSKIYFGTTEVYSAGGGGSYYDVGTPSFLMRFDGSWSYYSDGVITAEKVGTPSLTTGGPWGKGALAPTYDANDSSARNAIKINISKDNWAVAYPHHGMFIEFWAKMDFTDVTKYQTFLGNMIKDDSTSKYSGWSLRVQSSFGRPDVLNSQNNTSMNSFYNSLYGGTTTKNFYINKFADKQWAHYGFYINCQNSSTGSAGLSEFRMYVNGYRFIPSSTAFARYFLPASIAVDDIYIGNAKYGTGYTLSDMAEVRILLGKNASDYVEIIEANKEYVGGGVESFTYQVPTASFASGGLTKYTAS